MSDSAADLRFRASSVLASSCRYRLLSARSLEDPLEVAVAFGNAPPARARTTVGPDRRREPPLDELDPRTSKPLYTVSEASSYLGVPRSTFDTWVRGYERRPTGRRVVRGKALLTSIPGGRLTIPFIGLAEGMVLAAFRETGLPLQRIRPALERLDKEMGVEHALASQHLYTDGAELLFDYARSRGDKQLRLLTVVRSGQRVFHDVIDRYLKRIDYDGGWAIRLALPITDEPLLVADPDRAFGQPIFVHGAARLADVMGRIEAGEDDLTVAEDFGVPVEDVRAALASPIRAAA